ncbi:MAG: permease-like cell division protein FtsX [Defluviitaleaceae bacterium]|nr:permease-like cell division protein FtsX [Defluviitaleaceae bacterium]
MKTTKTSTNKNKSKSNNAASSLKLRNLRYYLSQTTKSLWRNKLMSLSSIMTVAACMIMIIISFTATSNVRLFLDHLENTAGMTVHLDDELTDAQRQVVIQSVLMVSNVANVRLVDPEEALLNMQEQFGFVVGALMDENPLGYSLITDIYDLRLQDETIEQISTIFGVYSIDASADLTDAFIRINNGMAIVGLALIALFGIFSIIIITNTIKLTVNNRRNEIIIMKYVGATDWFIRWPFIIEGILIGVLGGIIPLVITWFTYDGIISSLTGNELSGALLGGFPFRTTAEIFPILIPIVVLMGASIGVLGSASSMRKHLNV